MKIVGDMRAVMAASAEVYKQKRLVQHERLLHNEQVKNGVEWVMLLRNRIRSRADARKRNKVRIAALASVRQTLERAVKAKAQNIETIFNVALYLLLIDQDLAYFSNDMVCAIGDRRRAFVAKHEALLLYEAAKDVPELLGKKFRAAILGLFVPPQQVQKISAVSSELNRFWQTHREFLGKIRNALTAHREHDALAYAEGSESLEPMEVMARAAELSRLLELLVQELIEVARLTSSPTVILRDIVSSGGRGGAN
jgi:hypothetical protein